MPRDRRRCPAVIYGSGISPTPITVASLALAKVLRGGANALVDLKGDKSVEGKPVLVKEIQRDPLSRKVVHCDLYAVNLKARIDLEIPLHFIGIPRGVALDGGVLEPLLRTLEVSCMPLAIPESIDVDVSNLGIGDAIHVRDVVLPADVVLQDRRDMTVTHVVAPRLEEVVAPVAAVEGAPAEGGKARLPRARRCAAGGRSPRAAGGGKSQGVARGAGVDALFVGLGNPGPLRRDAAQRRLRGLRRKCLRSPSIACRFILRLRDRIDEAGCRSLGLEAARTRGWPQSAAGSAWKCCVHFGEEDCRGTGWLACGMREARLAHRGK